MIKYIQILINNSNINNLLFSISKTNRLNILKLIDSIM